MGLREKLNRHQTITITASLSMVVLVVIWIYRHGSGTSSIPKELNFYTTDDGATLFSDDSQKVPPFDHDGRQAVRAVVFTCDDGKHQFVQYLQKYSDDVKQQLEKPHSFGSTFIGLIKRPGETKWISESESKAQSIELAKCPDGNNPRRVFP